MRVGLPPGSRAATDHRPDLSAQRPDDRGPGLIVATPNRATSARPWVGSEAPGDGLARPAARLAERWAQSVPLVSIVIVNYNRPDLLADCLASVRAQTYPNLEVVVVDNASQNGSVDWVREVYPDVRVVALSTNRGFAGGCNAGIAAANGELIATVNNDVQLDPGWVEEMVRAARSSPGVGMVASKILFVRAPEVVDSAGVCLDRAGMAWHRRGGRRDDRSDRLLEVFGPCAGAALYRRALFDDVGLFDEDFFCYLEDVDLAWRARNAGWRCVYTPRACAYHHHSATAVEDSPFKRYHLGRNKVWMIAKNFPAPEVWLYLPVIMLYDLVGLAASALLMGRDRRSLASRLAGVVGRLAGLASLRTAVAKRQRAPFQRRVSGWRILGQMASVPGPRALYRRYAHLYET